MSRIKEFRQVEEGLLQKDFCKSENEIILEEADFMYGKLSMAGYSRIKHECEYIDYKDNIEITLPKKFLKGFSQKLEHFAADEIKHIKKDRRRLALFAGLFLLIGAFWFTLGSFFSYVPVVREITMVATWVFVWTAIEKWFFERNRLQDNRFSILHILTATLRPKPGETKSKKEQ